LKKAKLDHGEQVTASRSAPSQAFCPICGGTVVLRKRKKMGGDAVTYFWRHVDKKNTNCPARWKLH
jgi:hypothetical protein